MHEIGHEDFLKLYVKYNSERSIEDIIDNALKGNMSFTNFLTRSMEFRETLIVFIDMDSSFIVSKNILLTQ
jgi:hypothetical protein